MVQLELSKLVIYPTLNTYFLACRTYLPIELMDFLFFIFGYLLSHSLYALFLFILVLLVMFLAGFFEFALILLFPLF